MTHTLKTPLQKVCGICLEIRNCNHADYYEKFLVECLQLFLEIIQDYTNQVVSNKGYLETIAHEIEIKFVPKIHSKVHFLSFREF